MNNIKCLNCRFGRHRKMDFNNPEELQHYHQHPNEFNAEHFNKQQQKIHENGDVHNNKQHENQNSQSHPPERSQDNQREVLHQRHGGYVHHHAEQVQVSKIHIMNEVII